MDVGRTDGRLISWFVLIIETLCASVVVVSNQCRGESILLQRIQYTQSDIFDGPDNNFPSRKQGRGIMWPLKTGHEATNSPAIQRIKREASVSDSNHTTREYVTSDTTSDAMDVTDYTNDVITDYPTSFKTDTAVKTTIQPSTPNPTSRRVSTTVTLATTVTMGKTKAMSTVPTKITTQDTPTMTAMLGTATPEGISSSSSNESVCPEQDAMTTAFGEYGVGVSAGILAMVTVVLWILLIVVYVPKCLKRRKEKKKAKAMKTRIENLSDMRSPAAIYRPRPSLKNSPCVPTPLAMIPPNDAQTVTLHKDSRVVMTTDLDDTSDPDFDGNGTAAVDYPIDKPYSTVDRKFSTVSNADTANVSSFLLRQTSIRQEEDKRKHSIPS